MIGEKEKSLKIIDNSQNRKMLILRFSFVISEFVVGNIDDGSLVTNVLS